MIAKKVLWGIALLTLVASGVYVAVYLYRWEWNRALMAGMLLVAAEIGIATAAILDRLKDISRRLDEVSASKHGGEMLDAVRSTRPPARQHFAWLKGDGGDMNVFVPLLMGAGVLASGLAWVVERFARATARPALERSLAARLSPLALPDGGLVRASAPVAAESPRRIPPIVRNLAIATIAVIATIGVLDKLADATQTRPDVPLPGMHSHLEIEVFTRNAGYPHSLAARGLIAVCEGTVGGGLPPDALVEVAPRRFALDIKPALGKYAERRLRGCLEDAAVDNVQAKVVGLAAIAD